jgi:hypothetical protein
MIAMAFCSDSDAKLTSTFAGRTGSSHPACCIVS